MMAAASEKMGTTGSTIVDNQMITAQALTSLTAQVARTEAKANAANAELQGVKARLRANRGTGQPSLLGSVR